MHRSNSSQGVTKKIGVGARYELGEKSFIDAEARYFLASDIEMTTEDNAIGTITADYDPLTFAISVGLSF